MPDTPAPAAAPATPAPAAAVPAAATAAAAPVPVVAPHEQLHNEAIAAVEAMQAENDPEKRTALKETAKTAVSKAKEAAEKAGKESAAVKPVAPDKYTLTLPKDSLLPAGRLDKIAADAKAQGLSNEQAQAVVERESQAVADFQIQKLTELKAKKSEWLTESQADKEIGGGSEVEFKKNAELAKRVMLRYGSESFLDKLDELGLGNHPELVRVFVRIGKSMSEDQLVVAAAPGAKPIVKSAANTLYDKTPPAEAPAT